jgi:hypothetical protein
MAAKRLLLIDSETEKGIVLPFTQEEIKGKLAYVRDQFWE